MRAQREARFRGAALPAYGLQGCAPEPRFALPSGVKLRFTIIYISNLDTGY
jgi:hypothetical protein